MAACAIWSKREFNLVRESLIERAGLLKTAPHLVVPHEIPSADLWLAEAAGPGAHGRVLRSTTCCPSAMACRQAAGSTTTISLKLPRLRQEGLTSVLHYYDCLTDDARLTLCRPARCARPGRRYPQSPRRDGDRAARQWLCGRARRARAKAERRGAFHRQCERAVGLQRRCHDQLPHRRRGRSGSCGAATSCCRCPTRRRPTLIRCRTKRSGSFS